MMNTITTQLYGATKFVAEGGTAYTSLFIGQPADADDNNSKGIEVMKLSCDPDVFDTLTLPNYPHTVTLEIKLKKAAQGKLGQHCTKVVPVKQQVSPAAKG